MSGMTMVEFGDGSGYYDNQGNVYDTDGYIVGTANDVIQGAAAGNGGWLDTLNNLIQAAPQVVTGLTAYQLSQINIERAKRGQSPLTAAAYGPQVGVGLNAQTMNMVMMIAIGLGAVMLIKNGKR